MRKVIVSAVTVVFGLSMLNLGSNFGGTGISQAQEKSLVIASQARQESILTDDVPQSQTVKTVRGAEASPDEVGNEAPEPPGPPGPPEAKKPEPKPGNPDDHSGDDYHQDPDGPDKSPNPSPPDDPE